MIKYWILIKNEFQRHLAYRANIISYSFGHLFEVTSQVIIWSVIYQNSQIIKGYSYSEMITYVVVGWLLLFATSNYGFEEKIAKDIHQGTLSNLITKPISYLKYMTAVSLGRIVIAFITVIIIEISMILIFRSRIIIDFSFIKISILVVMMILAFFIRLFFAILIGLIGFWIVEISGTYFSLNILSKFLSGAYFPINLLPAAYVTASLFFPFAYTFFVPLQIYLGKASLAQGLKGILVEFIWLVLLYAIIKIVWHFGLKRYEAVGI